MPRVEIGSQGVWVKLDATEASIVELGKQAMELFEKACAVDAQQPTGTAGGLTTETRWFPAHVDPNGRYGRAGFAPVKADLQMGDSEL